MIPTISKSSRKLLCKKCVARFPLKKPAEFRKEMRKKRLGEQEQERLTKKEETARIRAECVKRAAGHCECGCRSWFQAGELTAEFDHFYGRNNETAEACWMLARVCHRQKTENNPNRLWWDLRFERHCERYGYPFTPRFGGRPKADARNEPSNALAIASARESR